MSGDVTAERAVVVGLGLIGSSIGLALRRAGWHVSGTDLDEARARRAAELGVVDEIGLDPTARLGIVATPVRSIAAEVAALVEQSSNPDLVITDVGSVKGPVAQAVTFSRFVGGHPMAGSEQEGPDGADADLFVGATWILTPTSATDTDAFTFVRTLATSLGAEVIGLPPERHDALVALVSHVPHLVAANLMAVAADAAVEHAALLRLAAGGFRDMTRIAAGDPGIWPDIFTDNQVAVLAALDVLRDQLDQARALIVDHDRDGLVALLEHARAARRNLPASAPRPEDIAELRVPIEDRPGGLAEIVTLLGERGINIFDFEPVHSTEGRAGVLVLTIAADSADRARGLLLGAGYRAAVQRLS